MELEKMEAHPDADYPKRYVAKQLRRMQKALVGIRGAGDVKSIHDVRVASRRLRTAFWVFKGILPRKTQGIWKKRVRKLAKSLGPARDLDVQIRFLTKMARRLKMSPHRDKVEKLCALLKQTRNELQDVVLSAVDAFEKSATLKKIGAGLKKKRRDGKRTTLGLLYRIGQRKVAFRLKELFKFEPYVYRSDNTLELHQMRIAAKHLRYTLECLKPLYGKETSGFISSAKKIQSALGRLHDFDVWMQSLAQSIPPEKMDEEIQEALSFLAEKCKNLRARTYRSFVKTWRRQRQEEIWYTLPQFIIQCNGRKETLPADSRRRLVPPAKKSESPE